MPVKIACPKCSKQYTLPDSAFGKAVKCKECGTAFRTKKPGAAQPAAGASPSKPVKPKPVQPKPVQSQPRQSAKPNLNEFGLDGGFQKQADIFGSPPPAQAGPGLGNFAEEDPGFGDAVEPIVLGPSGGAPVVEANPYQSVMTNSALRESKRRTGIANKKSRGSGASFDTSAYNIARFGMMAVFGSGAFMLLVSFLLAVVGLVFRIFPGLQNSMQSEGVQSAVGILILVIFICNGICMLVFAVGQVMCVFAPENDERMNAGGAAVLVFISGLVSVIGSIVMGATLTSWAGSGGLDQDDVSTAAVLGIGFLVVLAVCGLMLFVSVLLFANFYRKVGQNIKSKELVLAANHALISIGVSLGVFILAFVIALVIGMVAGNSPTAGIFIEFLNVVTWLSMVAACGMMLRMVWTGFRTLSGN